MKSFPSKAYEDLMHSSHTELLNVIKERDQIINELKENVLFKQFNKLEIQFLTLKSESTNKDLQAMDSKDQ